MSIIQNLADVKERIALARQSCLAPSAATGLVAVSKGHGVESIIECLEAGHRCYGENRVQEASSKWPELKKQFPGTELHLIGPLQSNKIKEALDIFDVIQTLDRPKLAEELAKALPGHTTRLFIQVNTGEEDQKSGIFPAEADAFITYCIKELALPVVGLMCIPPHEENPAPHFGLLRDMAKRHELLNLSMGMSGDYETAIRFGATHVRVGTAIFGPR